MENLENPQHVETQISVNTVMKDYLLETAKWGKFLAIVGYIGLGLLILAALVVIIGFSALGSLETAGLPMSIMGIMYLILAVLYYFPVTYLYRFSSQMKSGIKSNDQEKVTFAAENLKSMFKFMGIVTVVMLSIYALALIVILPIAMLLK